MIKKLSTPEIKNYTGTVSEGSKMKALSFTDTDGNVFYFSYKTLIGFYSNATNTYYARENIWGSTTGRHLNCIEPDKSKRLSKDEFYKMLELELGGRFKK